LSRLLLLLVLLLLALVLRAARLACG